MARTTSSLSTRYEPVRVEDWEQLNASIDDFIETGALSERTVSSYARAWSHWTKHCNKLGVDPLDAPYDAFTAYLTLTREDGAPYAASGVDSRLSGITHYYDKHWRTPAFEAEEVYADWRELRRGLARTERNARIAAGEPTSGDDSVIPLLRDDLTTLLLAEPVADAVDNAWLAATLLAFDHGLSPSLLASLRPDDVVVGEHSVMLDGLEVLCDHRSRERGVPWDCAACIVNVVLGEALNGQPLLQRICERQKTPQLKTGIAVRLLTLRNSNWQGASFDEFDEPSGEGVLRPSSDLSDWQLAGLRRALVLRVGPHRRGEYLRARFWISLAWAGGFRMCGDLLRLDRSHVRREVLDGGWTIDLGGTKDDPFGSKSVTRSFGWPSDEHEPGDDLSAARFMSEYLCVRDAVQGAGGFLVRVRPLTSLPHDTQLTNGATVAATGFARLAELAGTTSARYTSKSCRKGFADQALLDGWDVATVSEALRHDRMGVTLSHYVAKASAASTSARLRARLVAEGGDR